MGEVKRPTRDGPRELGRGHTTMERRKFVVGLGALASGSAAAMGTGAFTSVSADRSVDVNVEDDADAYLALTKATDSGGSNKPNAVYFDNSGDEHAVDFGDSGNSGLGVNPNADTVAESVFQIENQGTQPVDVSLSAPDTGDDLSVQPPGTISAPSSDGINAALAQDDDDSTSDNAYQIGTGEVIEVDLAINSGGDTTTDLSGELRIAADQP